MGKPLNAVDYLVGSGHETLNWTQGQRTDWTLSMMVMTNDLRYAFSLGMSQELSINLCSGCEHFGAEQCECVWEDGTNVVN